MPNRYRVTLLCFVLAAFVGPGMAQSPSPTRPMTRPGDELDVYLLTIEPGDVVYERFAHNAIWIRDYRAETKLIDVAYNYGMFTFGEGLGGLVKFMAHFLSGEMDYWVEPAYTAPMIAAYGQQGRTVRAQLLEMTPAQKVALRDALNTAIRDENKFYRYNYFQNNCSTKVRDALDAALGGQLADQLKDRRTGRTYRDNTRMILRGEALYVPLYAVLGQKVDEPLTAWDEGYLPMRLYESIQQVWVADESGQSVRLVKEDFVAYPGRPWEMAEQVPNYALIFVAIGVTIGGAMGACGHFASGRWARRGFVVGATLWSLQAAFCGWFGLYALTTHHWAAKWNENLLQFSPLALGLVVAIPAWARGKTWACGPAQWLAIACAGSAALGLVAKLLPMMTQVNWDTIALALPAQAGLALGMWRALRSAPAAPAADKAPSRSRKKT